MSASILTQHVKDDHPEFKYFRVVIAPRSLNLPHGNTSIKQDTRA